MKRIFLTTVMLMLIVYSVEAKSPFGKMHSAVFSDKAGYLAKPAGVQELRSRTEPTPTQLLFDVLHYELDVAFDYEEKFIEGCVTATVKSLIDSLYSVDFDAVDSLVVSSVSEGNGVSLNWSRPRDLIIISLSSGLARDEHREIKISYNCQFEQQSELNQFEEMKYGIKFSTHNLKTEPQGKPMIYSINGIGCVARFWWPCKDWSDDKATFDIYLSVPAKLFAASNGTYMGYTDETLWGKPYKRYHWQESYPMTTYNASIAATDYIRIDDEFEYAPGKYMPVTHYLYPEFNPTWNANNEWSVNQHHINTWKEIYNSLTVPMLEYFSSLFGLYPFIEDKYGVALAPSSVFMENQTMSTFIYIYTDIEYTFAHELVHQWFGNCVSYRDMSHMWLSKGFASYGAALWVEHTEGPLKMRKYLEKGVYIFTDYWKGPILREKGNEEITYYYDGVVYYKAALMLHMLRHVVGDETFFEILRSYVADPRFRYAAADTDDFIGVCEDHAGVPLDWFFDQWLTREDWPQYNLDWSVSDNSELTIVVDQLQNEPYKMPVDFRITTATAQIDTVLWVLGSHEKFILTLNEPVQDVQLDPDHFILCDITEGTTGVLSSPTAFMLYNPYPNPSNNSTTIKFSLSESGFVNLVIYNIMGQKVRELFSENMTYGTHSVAWDGRDYNGSAVSSGVYLSSLISGGHTATRRIMLIK